MNFPNAADSRADECIRQLENKIAIRGVWEGHWREIAERLIPTQNFFQQRQRPQGDKRTEKIFDSTAALALQRCTAAFISMVIPSTQKYHKQSHSDPKIADDDECKRYFDDVNDLLFRVRYAPKANFQSQAAEVMQSSLGFGTGVMFIDDVLGMGIRYKSYPLAETYLAENGHGVIDQLDRKFQLTAHQAATQFGKENLPEAIQKALERNPQQTFWFLHCVKPNEDRVASRKDYRGMMFSSYYIALEQRQVISEGGFRVFPFVTPRYETGPREVYGRSQAMLVLPTIKGLNEMKKTILRAAQKTVEPPIMLTDNGSLGAFSVQSNALNRGYLDDNGRPMAVPFNSGARVDIGQELMDAERDIINDAFFVTLFRILVDNPQITATEAMLRAQEKGELLAPAGGRLQTEFVEPMVERELDILEANGALPPMPLKLVQAGGIRSIVHTSPLSLAQRSREGVAIMNTIQAIMPMAQVDPGVLDNFDFDSIARELADINGVPEKILFTRDQVAAIKDQKAQAQQAQQLLQAAPVAASAAKDFAQAGAMAASAPNQQAPAIIPK